MSEISSKNVFLTMLQLPVSLGLALCAFAEKHFTHWMLALENPLSHPMTDLATKRAKAASIQNDEIIGTPKKIIKWDHYRAFNAWLLLHNDEFIDRIRVIFEAEFAGLMTDARRRDRHLYAVLKPTRRENLRRLKNVFRVLATQI